MPSKSYRKGYRFETRVRKQLEALGYTVFRQGKSAFPDLICFKRGREPMLVECKVNRTDLSSEELERLLHLALNLQPMAAYIAYRQNHTVLLEDARTGATTEL